MIYNYSYSDLVESESEIEEDYIDQDNSHDYSIPSDDNEPSDDEIIGANKKKAIPDNILWKMCETGISFNVLSKILKLSYSVLGGAGNFKLSSSHLFKRYQRMAEGKEIEYRHEIQNKNSFGTLCFDHQNMKQVSGKFVAKEDRLALLWHCDSVDKLLSIEKIADKSGRNQMESILRACESYNIQTHHIVAISCDNENTNTGNENGTCALLQDELQKNLLRMMCRHHIYEIVIKNVYKYLFTSEMPINLFHSILSKMW